MGLDTTHDCWHGPYSAFYRWRQDVQLAAGWHLEERRDGYWTYLWPREVNDADLSDENYLGQWQSLPEDPLVVLVAHSDCDGEIPIEALIPLAERLEELAPRIPQEAGPPKFPDLPRANYDGSKAAAYRFAAGLRRAAAAGEPVVFG